MKLLKIHNWLLFSLVLFILSVSLLACKFTTNTTKAELVNKVLIDPSKVIDENSTPEVLPDSDVQNPNDITNSSDATATNPNPVAKNVIPLRIKTQSQATSCNAQGDAARLLIEVSGLDEAYDSNLDVEIWYFKDFDTAGNTAHWQVHILNLNANTCTQAMVQNQNGSLEPVKLKANNLNKNYQVFLYKKSDNSTASDTSSINQTCYIQDPQNPQLVNSDPLEISGYAVNENAIVRINCKTPVKLARIGNFPNTQTLDLLTAGFFANGVKLYTKDNKQVASKNFVFESSDTNIASINEGGELVFKKIGNVEISVKANPNFYLHTQPVVFKFFSVKNNITIQGLDLGHSSILDAGSFYQLVVPNNKLIIRALVYADAADTKITNAKLYVMGDNSQTQSIDLTCPETLPTKKFANNHYDYKDTCYAILDAQEFATFSQNSIFKLVLDDKTRFFAPNIAKKNQMKIKIVKGISDSYQEAQVPPDDEIRAILKQVFPFSEVQISHRAENYNFETSFSGSPNISLDTALESLEKLQREEDSTNEIHYYAFIKSAECKNTIGLGYIAYRGAVGLDTTTCDNEVAKITMAHEFGHNLSLTHAPCGLPGNESVLDSFWQSGEWDGLASAKLSGAPIFDQASGKVLNLAAGSNPKNSDLMSYCDNSRLTKHNYLKVKNYTSNKTLFAMANVPNQANNLPSARMQMQESQVKTYNRIISGEILPHKIVLNPIDLTSNLNYKTPAQYASDYSVKVKTASFIKLYNLSFMPIDHSKKLYFQLVLPFDEAIESLTFLKKNKKIPYEIKQAQATQGFNQGSNQGSNQARSARKLGVETSKAKFSDSQPVIYKNKTLVWDTSKYTWLTCKHINKNGTATLLLDSKTGGSAKLPQTQLLQAGELEIVLANGLNNLVQRIKLD